MLWRSAWRVVGVLTLGLLSAAGPAQALAPNTVRASLSATGTEIPSGAIRPVISNDGRWVAFVTNANGLVGQDTNNLNDVYLKDLHTGALRRISQRPDGSSSDGPAGEPRMSADGRIIVFLSSASNLVPGGIAASNDVYVYDRVQDTLRRVTASATGEASNASEIEPQVSSDGSAIVFDSAATNLPASPAVASGFREVYVADTATLTPQLVSRTFNGLPENLHSGGPSVSSGGRFVAFNSDASNMVANDNNMLGDAFVRDMQTGVTTRVSVTSAGGEAAGGGTNWTSITPDGCQIAFTSSATNLAPALPVGRKVFVRNRCTNNTEAVSLDNTSAVITAEVNQPTISDDGCQVLFLSGALTGGLTVPLLRDRCQGTTSRMDLSTAGDPGNNATAQPRMSHNGRYVTFDSFANNLVAGDANGTWDAFVRDRATAAPPIADLQVSVSGRRVTVDASASSDPDNGIASAAIGFGDGSPEAAGLTASHDYARDGSFTVTLTVTDRDGLIGTAAKAVTVTGDAPAAAAPQGPVDVTLPPVVKSLALTGGVLSRARFAVVPKGGRVGGRRGATLLVNASEPATLTLTFERGRRGRRVAGRCTPGARKGARCTSYRAAGTLTITLRRGDNAIALTGRVAGKALKTGPYRLRAVARTADGRRSSTLTRTFTITRS